MAIYPKGYKRELIAKKILEAQGYNVIRSAGSHGPWDLVAYKDREIRFIQIKSYRPGPASREKMLQGPGGPLDVSREVWVYRKREGFEVYNHGGDQWIIGRLSTD